MSEIAQAMAWHDAVYQARLEKFGECSDPKLRVLLSVNLIKEETRELLDELVFCSGPDTPLELKARAAKEAADVLFVVIQAMSVLGVPFSAVFLEVLRENKSKLDGGVRFREDGKLLKGDSYSPADIAAVLEREAT